VGRFGHAGEAPKRKGGMCTRAQVLLSLRLAAKQEADNSTVDAAVVKFQSLPLNCNTTGTECICIRRYEHSEGVFEPRRMLLAVPDHSEEDPVRAHFLRAGCSRKTVDSSLLVQADCLSRVRRTFESKPQAHTRHNSVTYKYRC
jgi:hypothetical protein